MESEIALYFYCRFKDEQSLKTNYVPHVSFKILTSGVINIIWLSGLIYIEPWPSCGLLSTTKVVPLHFLVRPRYNISSYTSMLSCRWWLFMHIWTSGSNSCFEEIIWWQHETNFARGPWQLFGGVQILKRRGNWSMGCGAIWHRGW